MGATFDAVGFNDGNTRAIPAFFTMLGIGDGPFGFDLGAFASQAAGRHGNQTPVERLAVEGGWLPRLLEEWDREAAEFRVNRKPYLLYE